MAGELPDYLIGDKGVQLTGSPIHTPDGGLLQGQNVEFIREQGMGGIGSRRSLVPLHTVALAGAVQHVANLPFGYPSAKYLMVGLNSHANEAGLGWVKTLDGVTWTDITSTVLQKAIAPGQFLANYGGILGNPILNYWPQGVATYRQRAYFAGSDYVSYYAAMTNPLTATRPPLIQFDSVIGTELFRVPDNPASPAGSKTWWIWNVQVVDGIIYLCVIDEGLVGEASPTHKSRVLTFDPEDGALTQIGNRFGGGTTENPGGSPIQVASFAGRIFVVCTNTPSVAQFNTIYSILPGVDTTWTVDRVLDASVIASPSFLVYKGNLYMTIRSGIANAARIDVRSGAGAWTTALTATVSNVAYFGGLVEFDGHLFSCWTALNGATKHVEIWKKDGTTGTWAADLDVLTTYTLTTHVPGTPCVFRGALYWPFFDGSSTLATGFVLKRTTGGVWSKALDARGLLGPCGIFIDPSVDEPGTSPPAVVGAFSSAFSSAFDIT
jgi:hypothetical protein